MKSILDNIDFNAKPKYSLDFGIQSEDNKATAPMTKKLKQDLERNRKNSYLYAKKKNEILMPVYKQFQEEKDYMDDETKEAFEKFFDQHEGSFGNTLGQSAFRNLSSLASTEAKVRKNVKGLFGLDTSKDEQTIKSANQSKKQVDEKLNLYRERNPIKTLGAELLTDPLTYTPAGIATKGKFLSRVGKSAVGGSLAGGGVYAAHHYGDENGLNLDDLKTSAMLGSAINASFPILGRIGKGIYSKYAGKSKGQKTADDIVRQADDASNTNKLSDEEIAQKLNEQHFGAKPKQSTQNEVAKDFSKETIRETQSKPNWTYGNRAYPVKANEIIEPEIIESNLEELLSRIFRKKLPKETINKLLGRKNIIYGEQDGFSVNLGNKIQEVLDNPSIKKGVPLRNSKATQTNIINALKNEPINPLKNSLDNIKANNPDMSLTLKNTYDELSSHPRYNELIDMRQNTLAKDTISEQKNINKGGLANNGEYYRPSYETNYNSHFDLTKKDIRDLQNGRYTQENISKLESDLGRLDNDPLWGKNSDSYVNMNDDSVINFTHPTTAGAMLGFEQDENGNFTYNIEKGVMGVLGTKLAHKTFTNKQFQSLVKKMAKDEAIKLHDKVMNSPYAPVNYMAPVKSATQKEKRGIWNVTFNGKNATQVRKADENSIVKYEQGYDFDGKGKGALHIQKHLEDGSMGQVSQEELLDMGNIIRNGKLYNSHGKNVYELEKDGTMFKVITGNTKNGKERVITFYSDRNIGEGMHSTGRITSTSPAESVSQTITKNQDVKINSFPTISDDGLSKGIMYAQKKIGNAKLNEATKKATQKIKDIVDNDAVDFVTGHKIYQKKWYMGLRDKMIGSKNVNMENALELHEQLKLLPEKMRTDMYRYMSGDKSIVLDARVKGLADNYTKEIDNISQQLVNLGVLDTAQFEKFKGRYLHRVYEKDLSKEFNSLFQRGKTIKGVHSRGNEWTGTKAEYKQLLDNGELGDFFEGKIEATKMPDGKYKFKQDWTKEQRAKWGEVEDIAFSLPETLMRAKEMLEHAKLLNSVAKTKYVIDEPLDGYTLLSGKRYGLLNGKYVPDDIANDIDEFSDALFGHKKDGSLGKIVDSYKTLSTFWKKSHTVYNPTAHINNLMSNVTMQFMEGINPQRAFSNVVKGYEAMQKLGHYRQLTAKKIIGLSDNEAQALKALELDDDLQLYLKAQKAGLFGRSKLNDILNQYVNPNKTITKNGALQKVDEKLSNWYQGEDNIMRYSLLKSLTDDGMDFKKAIERVNKTIPDYTKPMSRLARFGRNSMLTPFISWTYYSTPIILRQLKERPERAVALAGALYGINQLVGVNPYDKEDIPQQNFSMKRIPIWKDGKEITTLKVDRWIPHYEILSPLDFTRNLLNGGAWKGIYEVLNNRNLYYGGKITYKDGAKGAYDIAKYATQQITPDVLDKAWNLAESKVLSKNARRKHPVIQPRSTLQEIFNLVGLNTLTYDKLRQREKILNERLRD
jgi:hypothetical protein